MYVSGEGRTMVSQPYLGVAIYSESLSLNTPRLSRPPLFTNIPPPSFLFPSAMLALCTFVQFIKYTQTLPNWSICILLTQVKHWKWMKIQKDDGHYLKVLPDRNAGLSICILLTQVIPIFNFLKISPSAPPRKRIAFSLKFPSVFFSLSLWHLRIENEWKI